MPLSGSSVIRSTDPSGDSIKTFDDGTGKQAQAIVLIDDSAAQVGIASNPLRAATQGAFGTNDVATPSATVTYVGKSDKSGTWLVQKVDTSSGTSIGWATATNNAAVTTYANAWTNRATLTYGRFDEAY